MDDVIENTINYVVEAGDVGTRLDVFIAEREKDLTRTRVQKLIGEGMVQVNGQTEKANYKLRACDEIDFDIPAPEELKVEPENIPLDILYEDQDLIVVNKPQGMVVHPASGNYHGTLVNALLYHCHDLSGINGIMRPGIVHRIDKDTSGVLMVAKNDKAHLSLAQQIKDHTVTRRYLALVHGNVEEPAGTVNAPIGRDSKDRKKMAVTTKNSKDAVTHYKTLERFGDYTLIEAQLETGRTHQIRVHMAYLGHPVVGDPLYGYKKAHFNLKGQVLHAYILGFDHPRTRQYVEFSTNVPDYFQKLLEQLRNKKQ